MVEPNTSQPETGRFDPTRPDPARRSPRWMRAALVVSLAINLAVLGIVGGTMLTHHNRSGGAERGMMRAEMGQDAPRQSGARSVEIARAERMLALGPYGTALQPADRLALAQALRGTSSDQESEQRRGPGFRALRNSFEATLTLLRDETFDADALRARIETQTEFFARRQAQSHDLLIARLADMTQAERAGFADRLEVMLRRGPGSRSGQGRGDAPAREEAVREGPAREEAVREGPADDALADDAPAGDAAVDTAAPEPSDTAD